MSSLIERGKGNYVRPQFNYQKHESSIGYPLDSISAQMLESIRNYLEGCQMLQCDVAKSIKRQEILLVEIRNLLKVRKYTRRKVKVSA